MDNMKKFEVNGLYSMRSACDHNCVWQFIVTARTAATITLVYKEGHEGKTIKCRVNKRESEWNGAETIYPLGRYSMAPVLIAR